MSLGDDDRRSLQAAAAENHRVWFRRVAAAHGAGAVAVGAEELFLGPAAMVFPRPGRPLDVDALMSEIRARRCVSAGCWSLGEDPGLGARLMAEGFGWGWRPHWMALALGGPGDPARGDPAPGDPAPGGASPRPAFAVEPARAPYARTLPYAPRGPAPPECPRLGVRLREKVIGQVTVNPDGEVAGIYDMGVVAKVRRRGIGLALIQAACREAARRGCRHAVLNATPDGERLYRRGGFVSLGLGRTWWWSPRPAPTPRQRALAMAVGAGDAEEIAALEPTAAELAETLPCGETPLVLALLLDRPQAAELLLRRSPGLVHRPTATTATTGTGGTTAATSTEDGAATLLHLAVEHDRPAFVELALAHGADPGARDDRFDATALGWAEHLGRDDIAARLRAVATAPG